MEEVKKAIAFLFKRKGRDVMSERDFVMSVSMDLHWFPARDAQRLMQIGLDSKLLIPKDGKLSLGFDITALDVPLDYTPSPTVLEAGTVAPNLFMRILDRLVSKTAMDRKQVVSMINSTQDELDLEADVAALVVGRDLGVDISDLVDGVEKQILSRIR